MGCLGSALLRTVGEEGGEMLHRWAASRALGRTAPATLGMADCRRTVTAATEACGQGKRWSEWENIGGLRLVRVAAGDGDSPARFPPLSERFWSPPAELVRIPVTMAMTVKLSLDIIRAILLFLPIKALLRFKLVSQSWRQLITDPDFAMDYYWRSMESPELLVVLDDDDERFYSADFSGLYDLDEIREIYCLNGVVDRHRCNVCGVRSDNRSELMYASGFLVGSHNGLICIFRHGKFVISNPSTRSHRMIPCRDLRTHNSKICMGFGYNCFSYDYKIMLVWCRIGTDVHLKVELGAIYSLNSDVWTTVDLPSMVVSTSWIDYKSERRLIFGRNAFHWIGKRNLRSMSMVIHSFNIDEMVYHELLLPPQVSDETFQMWLTLESLLGDLWVLCRRPIDLMDATYEVDMWIWMHDGTWNRQYVIQGDILGTRIREVVCVYSDDTLLLVEEFNGLVIYRPGDKRMGKTQSRIKARHAALIHDNSIPLPIKSRRRKVAWYEREPA